MTDVNYEKIKNTVNNLTDENVEGLLYKSNSGKWIMMIVSDSGHINVCEVNYCPWCGKRLSDVGEHTH